MTTNAVYVKNGTSFVWSNSTYLAGAEPKLGVYSATYDIDCASLGAAAARQSIKADLGNPRAPAYVVDISFEMVSDPAAGGSISLSGSHSSSATAANDNLGHASGVDGAYAATKGYTLTELLTQLDYFGFVPVAVQNAADGVQVGRAGIIYPKERYGQLIVVNNASVALHTDSIEFAVRFTPLFDDIQAAA